MKCGITLAATLGGKGYDELVLLVDISLCTSSDNNRHHFMQSPSQSSYLPSGRRVSVPCSWTSMMTVLPAWWPVSIG